MDDLLLVLHAAAGAAGLILGPLALWAGTPWSGLLGRIAAGRSGPGWTRAQAHGQGGSYIALVTAALVVSVNGPADVAAWVLPTAVGIFLIERHVAGTRQANQQRSAL